MTSILHIREKIKTWLKGEETGHFLIVCFIVLLGSASLGAWYLFQNTKIPIQIEYPKTKAKGVADNSIVASKNSTKYYFSYCSGVKRIQDKNKIYFLSEEEAKAAGYTLANGCE